MPAKLWMLSAGLVLLSLAWGVLGGWIVSQHASAASDVVHVGEPLALAAHRVRSDLAQGIGHGSRPAGTLAQASIDVQQARGDEILNLISRSGDTSFEQNFRSVRDPTRAPGTNGPY